MNALDGFRFTEVTWFTSIKTWVGITLAKLEGINLGAINPRHTRVDCFVSWEAYFSPLLDGMTPKRLNSLD